MKKCTRKIYVSTKTYTSTGSNGSTSKNPDIPPSSGVLKRSHYSSHESYKNVPRFMVHKLPVLVDNFELPNPKRGLIPHVNSQKLMISVTARVRIRPAYVQNI